jgi:hypothetical protein
MRYELGRSITYARIPTMGTIEIRAQSHRGVAPRLPASRITYTMDNKYTDTRHTPMRINTMATSGVMSCWTKSLI